MTPKQLHVLQHSLGLDEFGRGSRYRNHFVSSRGAGSDEALCLSLVELGFMRECRSPSFIDEGDRTFVVTPEGIAAVERESPKPPRVSKSRERYLAFLASDSDMSFGEWLRFHHGRRAQSSTA